jgi:DNA-3-methyladenine glycosylase I
MEEILTYCDYVNTLNESGNIHKEYHDTQYGFPINDDNQLFARLVLEINQAGLSWTTILKKQSNFFKAYNNFNINKIAGYSEDDIKRLLNDAGIIRNRLKINAAIFNAQKVKEIQKEYGSFKIWLDDNFPKDREEWTKLFKKTFRFTGSEIVNEFLVSTGYLPGAHIKSCPIYKKISKLKPKFMETGKR